MSVSTILNQMAADIGILLGSPWKELKYIYELEKNNLRAQEKAYGVGVGAGETVSGATKSVTVDQEFFVVLTDKITNRSSDSNQRAALSALYDKKEILDKNILGKKLNLTSIVLVVSSIGTDEPLMLNDGVIALTSRYIVKYRTQTT